MSCDTALGATGLAGFESHPLHVGLAGVLGTAGTFGRIKNTVGIHLIFESAERGGTGLGR